MNDEAWPEEVGERDEILDLDHSKASEHLGWLAAAADRLHEL